MGHSGRAWSSALAVYKDVNELSDSLYLVVPLLEDANLIRNRALAQFVDSESEIDHGWELNGSEVVAVRMYD
jgi:hypothetical protein